jgi:hypothetical protein
MVVTVIMHLLSTLIVVTLLHEMPLCNIFSPNIQPSAKPSDSLFGQGVTMGLSPRLFVSKNPHIDIKSLIYHDFHQISLWQQHFPQFFENLALENSLGLSPSSILPPGNSHLRGIFIEPLR